MADATASRKNSLSETLANLKFLTESDQLIIVHKEKVIDELCACEMRDVLTVYNRIKIKKTTCCGHCRRYEYVATDPSREDLLYFYHPTDCCACLQKFEVIVPPHCFLGTVSEDVTCCRPQFTLRSADNEILAKIQGPVFACCASSSKCGFKVKVGKTTIGRIGRGIKGLERKFTNSGYISVTYPKNLDAKTKALILGAAVLINFVYYYQCSTRKTFWIVSIR